jgi:hypothetical protein
MSFILTALRLLHLVIALAGLPQRLSTRGALLWG